ncbi:aldehyde ferredoxin oxidoreductase [Candidatus Bathyarchaeota archaeon]|nr:MAG: aldehyde ferredoxin oxidoreductase [Candidatus Bathyarchaeota archaeon]
MVTNNLHGWTGKCLTVDLSKKVFKKTSLEREILLQYMGGRGLGVRLLWELVDPKTDPYTPENLLVLATGPLTATQIPTTGRISIIGKSPLTNGVFYSSCGGFFGVSLKQAGFDVLVIRGKSERPVYLYVDNDFVEIRDVSHLWGKTTKDTLKILEKDLGKDFEVVCIGPAGENLVRYACIACGPNNFAGRGGLGAVMGSKNLKAIAVRGTYKPKIAKEKSLNNLLEKCRIRIRWNPILDKALSYYGTSALVNLINEHRILPTKNFQQGWFEHAEKISGETLKETIFVEKRSCYNCPIACKRKTKVNDVMGEGPEFETIGSLGSMLLIDDIKTVAEINYLCNEFGLDTISTGGTIACAMELSEKGLLEEKINWGDVEKVKELVIKTVYKKGLGKLLAEGSRFLAKKYGCEEVSMQVKGLELPMYDPRGVLGQALAYATSNRGGCHLNAYMIGVEILGYPYLMDRFSPVNKPSIVVYMQNLAAAIDSMVLCKFLGFEFDEETFANFLSYVTGENFSQESVISIGERIWNLERLFNFKAGLNGKTDNLPKRFQIPLQKMLEEYYLVRKWTVDGFPTPDKLKSLGLPVK